MKRPTSLIFAEALVERLDGLPPQRNVGSSSSSPASNETSAQRFIDVVRCCVVPLWSLAVVVVQIALLCCASWAGHELVARAHIPLPGNIAGLVLMFLALWSGVVPLRCVERGATLLVRHLSLFFVPIAAGLTTFGDLLAKSGWGILGVLAGSSIIGLVVTGHVSQAVAALQGRAYLVPRNLANERRLDSR